MRAADWLFPKPTFCTKWCRGARLLLSGTGADAALCRRDRPPLPAKGISRCIPDRRGDRSFCGRGRHRRDNLCLQLFASKSIAGAGRQDRNRNADLYALHRNPAAQRLSSSSRCAIDADPERGWQYPECELDKLLDPQIKAFLVVNPSNPASVKIDKAGASRIAQIIATNDGI